jgi:hypothetical protein
MNLEAKAPLANQSSTNNLCKCGKLWITFIFIFFMCSKFFIKLANAWNTWWRWC